jgi:hypothetical protein
MIGSGALIETAELIERRLEGRCSVFTRRVAGVVGSQDETKRGDALMPFSASCSKD